MSDHGEDHPRSVSESSSTRGQFEKVVRSTTSSRLTPFLGREDIIDAIRGVIGELRAGGQPATLQLIGGAAMVLMVNADRRLTRDVDAALAPQHEVERAARTVAERRGWPADWLNADAEQFLPSGFGRNAEWTTIYQDDLITIQTASIETLLAMKLHATQRRGMREAEDLIDLFDRVGVTSVDEAEALYEEFYPGDEFTRKTATIVEGILGAEHEVAPEPPAPDFT